MYLLVIVGVGAAVWKWFKNYCGVVDEPEDNIAERREKNRSKELREKYDSQKKKIR